MLFRIMQWTLTLLYIYSVIIQLNSKNFIVREILVLTSDKFSYDFIMINVAIKPLIKHAAYQIPMH